MLTPIAVHSVSPSSVSEGAEEDDCYADLGRDGQSQMQLDERDTTALN